MVTIYTQSKYMPEKVYIFDVIFNEFLGFRYNISFHDEKTYKLTFKGDKSIVFKDTFFAEIPNDSHYLKAEYLPLKPSFLKSNNYTSESDLPLIFGDNSFEEKEDEIVSGQDIFASAFFMLTRWEENVKTERDKYNRFPDKNAFVQQYNLQYRPLVNEYTSFLLNLLRSNGYSKNERKHEYTPVITHDVDFIARYDSFKKYFKALGGDILHRKSIKSFFQTNLDYFKIKLFKKLDNYDTFDFLMDISEQNNLKSNFYFIPAYINEEDARYDIRDHRIKSIIDNIDKRGHKIGFHGPFRSYNNFKLLKEEQERLINIHFEIKEGRQHYLRFANPNTWQILDDAMMRKDSTMGFSYGGGFRAGTCFEYSVFNIEKRKKLRLKEMPLIAMEVGIKAKYSNKDEFMKNIIFLSKIVRKYNGNFVFLWHNSNFNTFEWNFATEYYKKIMNEISK